MPIFHKDEDVTIMINPTSSQIKRMLKTAAYGDLRATLDQDGDLYVWDADAITHGDVEMDHGIDGLRLNVDCERVWINLAGGAQELLDEPEKVDAFFETYGHSGSTLENQEAIIAICETIRTRISSIPAIEKLYKKPVVDFDIDPRTETGLTSLDQISSRLQRHFSVQAV